MANKFPDSLKLELPLTPDHYDAIGHVIAQWAYIEREINYELHWLLTRRPNKREKVNYQARFPTRVGKWTKMAELTYPKGSQELADVHRISGRAVKIKRERDDLAHCTISRSGEIYSLLQFRNGRLVDINDDAGTVSHIQDLACRISKIGADLQRHQTELSRRYPGRP